jgi:hypothetical protein
MRFLRPLAGVAVFVAAAFVPGCAGRVGEPVHFDPDTIPDAYSQRSGALMWPGATRAFRVTPAGDLENGAWVVRVIAVAGGDTAGPPEVIAAEDRWRPVLRWIRRGGGVTWRFEAVALQQPAPADTGVCVSLHVDITADGGGSAPARLEFVLEPRRPGSAFAAFDARPGTALRWGTIGSRDVVLGWGPGEVDGARLSYPLTATGGSEARARVVLAAYPSEASVLADWARPPHEERVTEARRHWERALEEGTRFALGDPEVENALRAANVVLLSLRERRGPIWVPIGGPFHYRDIWLRDGARAVYALSIGGFTRVSRELARGLAEFQWPNGAFLSQRGQLDGTGQALWAFEQSMLRPAADDSVARYAEAALKACRWIEWMRGLGAETGWPYGTMMPFGDPRDAELIRGQLTGNDAWSIAGYRSAARLLQAAGRGGEAEGIESARARYVADFTAALERRGAADVPPAWQPGGRDWGNVSVAWPAAALSVDDPRVERLARRLWADAGGAGLVSYGPADSAHYYLGVDLGMWALLAGHRAQADSVLEAMLRWRSASGTAGEIFSRSSGGYGANLTPHPTSAAALVTLVRNALIEDHGDTLRLTLGARDRWWRDARIEGAPTRFGTINLAFSADDTRARWTWTRVPVWTALTLPPGRAVTGALPRGFLPGSRADIVLAPPGTESAEIAIVRTGSP